MLNVILNSLQVFGGGAFTGRQFGVGIGPEAQHQRGAGVGSEAGADPDDKGPCY